jgi:protein-S-isoprenylcysteine O-methyltransferase Ste14
VAWQIGGFVLVSAAVLALSWRSLGKPRSHGFPRFFAWEAIAALFFMNADTWWIDPFAWNQLVSWGLLIASIVPVIWGSVLLARAGRPTSERRADDLSLFAFEATSRLVTTGIFRYIRHPLYSSLLLLAWGIFFKHPSLVGGVLAVVAAGLLTWAALADEVECRVVFGREYENYMRRTKRFIPFLF